MHNQSINNKSINNQLINNKPIKKAAIVSEEKHKLSAITRIERSNWKVRLLLSIMFAIILSVFKPLIMYRALLIERMTFSDYAVDVLVAALIISPFVFLALSLLNIKAMHKLKQSSRKQ